MLNHIAIVDYKNFGQLAEMLLFYDKVTLFANEKSLRSLFKQVDPGTLIPFFEEHKEKINIHYLTWGVWASQSHYDPDVITFGLGDEETLQVDEPFLNYLSRTSSLDTPNGYKTDKKLTTRLLDIITKDRINLNYFEEHFDEDLLQNELPLFARNYSRRFPQKRNIYIPEDLHFISNRDSRETWGINVQFKTSKILSWPEKDSIHRIVSEYIKTLSNLPIWANMSSEIMTNERSAFIIRSKINKAILSRINTPRVINTFQEVFIPDARTIKEVINSGEKTFNDFLNVYEKATQFKEWVSNQPVDENLLTEYYRSIIKDNWIEKLPNKTIRWVLFTLAGIGVDALGAGGIGTISGGALGAFDTFILDKLINEWKPNQFVDKELKEFLSD